MHERGFVLIPLSEIAPNAWHPVLKKTIAELRDQLKDSHEVKRIGSARVVL
jgi:7,8-dihydro-6-hydroxymethylpterin-pyrophosphokinase